MTARAYSSQPWEEDFLFPEATEPTVKVHVRCRCGVRQVGSLRMAVSFIEKWIRREPILPGDLAASAWCRDCKSIVKVTARALHLA